jgi:cell division septal protein FtsQ
LASPGEPSARTGPLRRVADRSTRDGLVKRRRRRVLRRLYGLARLAAAGAVAWTIYWLWTGPFWRWDGQMAVSGNRLVGKQEIFSRLHVPQNTPLYLLNPQAIASQLGAIPSVAQVAVRRWLFPARLEVMILERQALVRVEGPKGEPVSRWIDQEGVVFAAPGSHMQARFPIRVWSELQPGDHLPAEVQTHLFELLNAWPKGAAGRLDLRKPRDVMASIGGWPVRLGEVAEIELKFAMFEHVRPEAMKYKDRLKYINLRFPESPTFVLKTGDEIKLEKARAHASPKPAASPAPASPRPSVSP